MKDLFKKTNNSFIIVGASFGALLALELANKLETIKMKGQLILIDGAPDYLKHPKFYSVLSASNEYEPLINTIFPSEKIDLELFLREAPTVENKFKKVLELFKDSNDQQSLEVLTNVMKGAVDRLKFCKEYDDSHLQPIESNILLIRSSDSTEIGIDNAYGLNKYARQNVAVKYVKGTHFNMYKSPELPKIINEIL